MASFIDKLTHAWQSMDSLVCVGLDPDEAKLPSEVAATESPYFVFCKAIIDATAPHVCAFKPQFAHFAAGYLLRTY